MFFKKYLGEREKDIENLKDFSAEKEYYKSGEKAAQWSNYEKGRRKFHVPRSDRVRKVHLNHNERKTVFETGEWSPGLVTGTSINKNIVLQSKEDILCQIPLGFVTGLPKGLGPE